jgi:hypothetical protein
MIEGNRIGRGWGVNVRVQRRERLKKSVLLLLREMAAGST